ncbi:MAG: hypothetical protein AB7F19_00515 [Candidatus Babeliales bacterium]
MFKKMVFVLIITLSNLVAMDRVGMSASCNGVATTSRNVGVLARSVDAMVQNEGLHSQADQNRSWDGLLKRATSVLNKGSIEQQHKFFGDVLAQTFTSIQQQTILGKPRLINKLLNMALFFRHNNCLTNPLSVWQCLGECKVRIDKLTPHDMSDEDWALTACLFKVKALPVNISMKHKKFVALPITPDSCHACSRNNACFSNNIMCGGCKANVKTFVRESLMDICCENEHTEKGPCESCGRILQWALLVYVKELTLAFHQFGYSLERPEHRALVTWAIMYKSSKKK